MKINFYIQESLRGFSNNPDNHEKPSIFPSIVFVHDPTWNDYNYKTNFNVFFYKNKNSGVKKMGFVAIGNKKSDKDVYDKLPKEKFFSLEKTEFFILGNSKFYKNMGEIFNNDVEKVLKNLNDLSFNKDLFEKVKDLGVIRISFFRSDHFEKMQRIGKYIALNKSTDIYGINVNFAPKYENNTESIKINFNFNEDILVNRMYAIIGKNGVGKTQLLNAIIEDIYKKWDNYNYSKVISLYSSDIQNFKHKNNRKEFENISIQSKNILPKNIKSIKDYMRVDRLRKILLNFISEDKINIIFKGKFKKSKVSTDDHYRFVGIKTIKEVMKTFSSGESIMFNLVINIISKIRLNSLILIDEPEVYLHPNYISTLTNIMYELTKEFESFYIFATHSPITIQGLFSKNIYVMDKFEGNVLALRNPCIETFAQNLTVITNDIFGSSESDRLYRKIINDLYDKFGNYENTMQEISKKSENLTLNGKLYLRSKKEE